jgi:hypothetical protein
MYLLIDRQHCVHLAHSAADPDWIRIQWGPWIRIRIQEGKNTTNILLNFIFGSAGCFLLRAEGFSDSLDISKLQF